MGELRRFMPDAFMMPTTLTRFNGEMFIVISVKPKRLHQQRYKDVEILICGELNTGWSDKKIKDCSEVISG